MLVIKSFRVLKNCCTDTIPHNLLWDGEKENCRYLNVGYTYKIIYIYICI